MSEPFIGEIRAFGFNYAPHNWAFCDGAIMPVMQNTALFALLGSNYGGNGTQNFALPDLRGSAVMSQGFGPGLTPRSIGESTGTASVTLNLQELPYHEHELQGATVTAAAQKVPAPTGTAMLSNSNPGQAYSDTLTPVAMAPTAIAMNGSNLPHNNLQPAQALNFCIALYGIWPQHP